ncbi:hypothetical protein [Peredibacter starrii]|uniref:Uncharacterized protein n=1 Tax=Peredibacter starrii TaxID=28202 RepID=A0AAX4HUZ0_9BACT|nr:hypothetical protein [Peredibacter starrii]WPU67112.1 hypothetical protein SOO65_10135 [Peredibacter starrii]
MKLFALVFSLLAFSAAHASSKVLVYEVAESYWKQNPDASFSVNKMKSDAFITFTTETIEQDPHRVIKNETKVAVPALSIRDGQTIQLEQEGSLVDCATVQTRGVSVFRWNKVTETGCTVKVETVRKVFNDNGYTRKMRVHQVFIVVK